MTTAPTQWSRQRPILSIKFRWGGRLRSCKFFLGIITLNFLARWDGQHQASQTVNLLAFWSLGQPWPPLTTVSSIQRSIPTTPLCLRAGSCVLQHLFHHRPQATKLKITLPQPIMILCPTKPNLLFPRSLHSPPFASARVYTRGDNSVLNNVSILSIWKKVARNCKHSPVSLSLSHVTSAILSTFFTSFFVVVCAHVFVFVIVFAFLLVRSSLTHWAVKKS